MKIVIGIDPDSFKHGIAIYRNGDLVSLEMWNTIELRLWLDGIGDIVPLVSIENVLAQNFVYSRNRKSSRAVENKVALSVGRNQQAQEELMRELDHRGIPYVLHKPTGMNWADNQDRFKASTGWMRKSNKDTRSAAFFGWLEVKNG